LCFDFKVSSRFVIVLWNQRPSDSLTCATKRQSINHNIISPTTVGAVHQIALALPRSTLFKAMLYRLLMRCGPEQRPRRGKNSPFRRKNVSETKCPFNKFTVSMLLAYSLCRSDVKRGSPKSQCKKASARVDADEYARGRRCGNAHWLTRVQCSIVLHRPFIKFQAVYCLTFGRVRRCSRSCLTCELWPKSFQLMQWKRIYLMWRRLLVSSRPIYCDNGQHILPSK